MEVQDSSDFVYEVKEENVTSIMKTLCPFSLRPVPGTYKMHQITSFHSGEMWYRDVSCTCAEGFIRPGHEWKFYNILNSDSKKAQTSKRTSGKQNDTKSRGRTDNQAFVTQNDINASIDERSLFYKTSLDQLVACSSYIEIKRQCVRITEQMNKYEIDYDLYPSIMVSGLQVDEDAMDMYPYDIASNQVMYPV